MNLFAEILVSALIVFGGVFGLVGSFGMVKLSDTMRRLHAPTKATTLGIGGVLIGSMAYFFFADGEVLFHELMITLFLFLTAPVTANFVSKVYMLDSVKENELPLTETGHGWAGYNDPPENKPDNSLE